FLNRTGGYRFYELALMHFVRKPEWTWLKDWNPHGHYRGYYAPDGSWINGQVHFDFTELEIAGGGLFGPEWNLYHEGLKTPFKLAPGITLPAGSYDYLLWGFDWKTSPGDPLSMILRGDWGPFYDGKRYGGNITLTYRQGASVSSSLLYDYTDLRMKEG